MATMVAKMPSQVAPMAALALGVGGCAVAGYVCGQHGHPAGAAERQPPQREPEPEQERPKMTLAEPEAWLRGVGVLWVDGRAPPAERRSCDVADLAVELAAFSAEVAREANGQGGVVDRKPHKQRMSADFGGPMHDGGANTRLGGRHTQAMLAGDGPGARGLRRRWELLDAAVSEICAEARLIQMFAVVGTGQGQGATTGEPHADAQRDRETGQPIGARGTIHLVRLQSPPPQPDPQDYVPDTLVVLPDRVRPRVARVPRRRDHPPEEGLGRFLGQDLVAQPPADVRCGRAAAPAGGDKRLAE